MLTFIMRLKDAWQLWRWRRRTHVVELRQERFTQKLLYWMPQGKKRHIIELEK